MSQKGWRLVRQFLVGIAQRLCDRIYGNLLSDPLVEMALIDLPRNRQPYSSRKHATAIGDSSQYGGGFPHGAQVCPTGSRDEKPTSSKNTMSAPMRRAFFYTRPIMTKPRFNQSIIPLGGTRNRELRCPAPVS